jgi:hypothetical protein
MSITKIGIWGDAIEGAGGGVRRVGGLHPTLCGETAKDGAPEQLCGGWRRAVRAGANAHSCDETA